MQFEFEKRFPATEEALQEILAWLEEVSMEVLPLKRAVKLQLVAEEIIVNIIRHGYKDVPTEPYVMVSFSKQENRVLMQIVDGALPFNPLENINYDNVRDVQKRKLGGMGRPFIVKFADEKFYRYENGCNVFTAVFNTHNV